MGDERMVPPEDPDANQRLVRESLLDPVGGVRSFTPMPTAGRPDDCAAAYQAVHGRAAGRTRDRPDPPGHGARRPHRLAVPGRPRPSRPAPTELVAATERPQRAQPPPPPDPDSCGPSTGPGWPCSRWPARPSATRWPALRAGRDLPAARVRAREVRWLVDPAASARPRAPGRPPSPRPRADLLAAPLDELVAEAPQGPRPGPREPGDLLAQGLHPPHHAVPRPVRLLHLRQGPGPPGQPLPVARRGAGHRPGRPEAGLPRGAVHPGRAARAALPAAARPGWPSTATPRPSTTWLRHVRAGARGDRPPPPRQRRRPVRRRAGRAAAGDGQPGDDARDPGRGPGRPPPGPRQDAGAAPGHPGGGRRLAIPFTTGILVGHRRDPGRPVWPPWRPSPSPTGATATSRR